MDLPPSARRALVGSVPLPVRGTTARQLHLDGSKLLVGIDGGVHCGTPFSCASQTVALYDMRALRGSSCSASAARPLWEARVPGSATVLNCVGAPALGARRDPSTLVLGTCTGLVLVWNAAAAAGATAATQNTNTTHKAGRAELTPMNTVAANAWGLAVQSV